MRAREMQAAAAALLALLEPNGTAAMASAEETARRLAAAAAAETQAASALWVPDLTEAAAAMQYPAGAAPALPVQGRTVPVRTETSAVPVRGEVSAAAAAAGAVPAALTAMTAAGEQVGDPEGALEALDRVFRRDSRRYDSGFSLL